MRALLVDQSINIYFEGYTIHSGLPDTFKVFLLEFSLSLVSCCFSGYALAHREPKSLRNLVPGAICDVHFVGIFRNT